MATTYDLTSNVEFTANFTTPAGGFPVTANTVYSAFSQTGTIVSVLFGPNGQTTGGTINAGSYSHVEYNAPAALSASTTTLTIGETSQAATSSYYSTGTNKLSPSPSTSGPSDANRGYGTLEIGPIGINTTFSKGISFSGINNTLVFDTNTPNIAALGTLNNFQGAGDQIVFNGVGAYPFSSAITGYNNGTLTYVNNGITYHTVFGGMAANTSAANFAIGYSAVAEGGNASSYAGNLVISYVPCFLRGTMIATPHGERPVESLRAGDIVSVVENGVRVARPLTWTGGQFMDTGDFADPEAMFPIRIRSGAFSDNVPHRDLLITPEHCILTEAGLVPARMLVNGSSILIDRSIPDYAFFHLELERHGILLSEGLTTESYLDSGNRAAFASGAGTPADMSMVMAAPLAIDRAVVEPLWNRLVERARLLGFAPAPDRLGLTSQPDLRLLLDDGRELDACLHHEHRHMFHIPRGTRPLRLLSRAAIPAETVGPFIDDRRTLGVAVDRLVFWAGLNETVLPVGDMNLRGWHSNEACQRWTDGNAELDLPEAGPDTFLDIHIAATMLYREEALVAA